MSRGVATRGSVDGCNEVSPVLSVREFLDKCTQSLASEALECQPPEETDFKALAEEIGVSEDTVAQLTDICQYGSLQH